MASSSSSSSSSSREEDVQQLPLDLVFEILSRISSVQALDSCKLVSKEWQRLLDDSTFRKTISKRGNIAYGFFLQNAYVASQVWFTDMFVSTDQSSSMSPLPKIPFDNELVRIMASCKQGILLCVKGVAYYIQQHYVCKPATGQWANLPNPPNLFPNRFFVNGAIMVMESTAGTMAYLHYKIVRLHIDGFHSHRKFEVEIFDSKDWTWTTLEDLVLRVGDRLTTDPAISVGNTVYWRLNPVPIYSKETDRLLYFCMDDYSFNDTISLPEFCNKFMEDKVQLIEYKGKLGFMRVMYPWTALEVWQFSNNSSNRWTREIVVNMRNVERYPYLRPAGFLSSSEIVLFKKERKMGAVVFSIEDGSSCEVGEVKDCSRLPQFTQSFRFRSDFEPVNLRPPWLPPEVERTMDSYWREYDSIMSSYWSSFKSSSED